MLLSKSVRAGLCIMITALALPAFLCSAANIEFPNHVQVLSQTPASTPTVLKSGPGQYEMWYEGQYPVGHSALFRASSEDGLNWTSDGPVLTHSNGGWDSVHVYNASVIKEGGIYKMWYTGYNGSSTRVGYATSNDGINWTKHPNGPVLINGDWDSRVVRVGTVLFDARQQHYRMWYTGGAEWFHSCQVGYATSIDGINWTKHPRPVLAAGNSVEWIKNHCSVVGAEGQLELYFASSSGEIQKATSSDGINWSVDSGKSVLKPRPCGWDSQLISGVSVLADGSVRKLWYAATNGSNQAIGFSLSAPARLEGDENGDGVVNIDDLVIVITRWGSMCN